jgi:hypothetical protein
MYPRFFFSVTDDISEKIHLPNENPASDLSVEPSIDASVSGPMPLTLDFSGDRAECDFSVACLRPVAGAVTDYFFVTTRDPGSTV